jgi:hypothetical protein
MPSRPSRKNSSHACVHVMQEWSRMFQAYHCAKINDNTSTPCVPTPHPMLLPPSHAASKLLPVAHPKCATRSGRGLLPVVRVSPAPLPPCSGHAFCFHPSRMPPTGPNQSRCLWCLRAAAHRRLPPDDWNLSALATTVLQKYIFQVFQMF